MRLIDSHAHLNLDNFKKDLDDVIARAKEAGLCKILVVGIDRKSGERALALKQKYKEILEVALGFHPHEVKNIKPQDYDWLKSNLPQALALGEIGLDFYKEYSPRGKQYEHFEYLLNIARELNKPIILHLRSDTSFWDEALNYLKSYQDLKMVFHCFTEGKEVAKRVLEFNSLVSIPGVITFSNAKALREAVRILPLERLILETDCPFLTPHPFRGKRNEPAYLIYIAKAVAELKGLKVEELSERTTENFLEFFGLERNSSWQGGRKDEA